MAHGPDAAMMFRRAANDAVTTHAEAGVGTSRSNDVPEEDPLLSVEALQLHLLDR